MPLRCQTSLIAGAALLLLWLFIQLSDFVAHPGPLLLELAAQRLAEHRRALETLNGSRWGDFAPTAKPAPAFVNITGFRDTDGLAWDDLEQFREKSLRLSRYAVSSDPQKPPLWDTAEGESVWRTASCSIEGDWVYRPGSVARSHESYNLSSSVPGIDWAGDRVDWGRNLTGSWGRLHLRVEDNKNVTEYEQLPRDQAPLSGGSIRTVRAILSLEDTTGSGSTWEMRLCGVHWPRQGVMMMTTTSEKFQGIFGLPHLTPAPDFFESSKTLLKQRLGAVLDDKEKNVNADQTMPWSSEVHKTSQFVLSPLPQCEYVMYAQVHTLDRDHLRDIKDDMDMSQLIGAIEDELASPMGAPIGYIPQLRISAVIYSPDCAFFIETKGPPEFPPGEWNHLEGVKAEVQTHRVKTWLLVLACIVFGQVFLLKNQIKETFTPSTMGRVSFGTVSVMLMMDGITFMASATWVSSAGATFLPTMALMFAAFLSMAIGGNFLSKIYEVQFPENHPRTESLTNAAAAAASTTAATPASGPLLPGPVVAATGNVDGAGGGGGALPFSQEEPLVVVPLDGDVEADIADGATAVPGLGSNTGTAAAAAPPASPRQIFQSIVGRFILSGLVISFVTLSSTTWYPSVRAVYLNLCALAYLSLWTPQIYRNAVRNCRRALTWPFVLGQSALRIAPVAYLWLVRDNFLFARTAPRAFAVVAAWLWLQIVALAAQDILGPRFAVPVGWLPDAWDYHPVLREDNVEAGGLPIGLLAVGDEDQQQQKRDDDDAVPHGRSRSAGIMAEEEGSRHGRSGGDSVRRHLLDCSICQEVLEVPVVRARGRGGGHDGGGGGGGSVASVFARRMYMVTPCRHIFHSICLESWIKFRLQCPICREDLPPL